MAPGFWLLYSILMIQLLLIALFTFTGTGQDKDEAARKDLLKLQGTWKLVSGMQAGTPLPAAQLASITMVIQDNLYEFRNSEETEKGKLVLDPGKKPAQFDIIITSGSFQGQKQLGIYEITGAKVRFCITMPDDPKRPEKFESTQANQCMIFEFEQGKK